MRVERTRPWVRPTVDLAPMVVAEAAARMAAGLMAVAAGAVAVAAEEEVAAEEAGRFSAP